MRLSKIVFCLGLLICGCHSSDSKVDRHLRKDFGMDSHKTRTLSVEIDLDRYEHWKAVVDRAFTIACTDSIPCLVMESGRDSIAVYLNNPCWPRDIVCVSRADIVMVHNDLIGRTDDNMCYLDSLEVLFNSADEVLGRRDSVISSLRKTVFWVSYDDDSSFAELPITLIRLAEKYERLAMTRSINVWLFQKLSLIDSLDSLYLSL